MSWEKEYSVSTDITGAELSAVNLLTEINSSSIASGTLESISCGNTEVDPDKFQIVFDTELSAGDKTTLDGLVLNHEAVPLADYKQEKFSEIDSRTGELIIAGGFTYNSKNFSLSQTAQLNLLGVDIKRNDGILPLTFNTKDNLDTQVLTTATEVDNFFMTALGAKKAHLDSGTALKDSVRAATDKAGVDAVVDNR